MKRLEEFISQVKANVDALLHSNVKSPHPMWETLLKQHPVDIALTLDQLEEAQRTKLFSKFPQRTQELVFDELSVDTQLAIIEKLNKELISRILQKIPASSLVYLLEHMSDDDLEKYIKLTQKKRRQSIISSLNCDPKTAGRLVNSDVLTVQKEFTIKKCINLMQRLGKNIEARPRIYVKDEELRLVGYVKIGDLVLNKPETPISHIMHKPEAYINAYDTQEKAAALIKHYSMPSIPVVDDEKHFLGAITASNVLEVIEDEMEEDSYKMSGLSTTEKTYTDRPFWKLVFQRSMWLAPLLLFQSISGSIMSRYSALLTNHTILFFFLTMLIGTGGNAGNQSATLVVRGLVTGEINRKNLFSVILKELAIAVVMGLILLSIGGLRVIMSSSDPITMLIICLSLFAIVVTSILLGTLTPIILDKMGFDPAYSAAPFLSTLMDIVGTLMYCTIASLILRAC